MQLMQLPCLENAEKWNIDTDKVIVCGFSAGGHLAASLSALWNDSEIFSEREIELAMHKPNAQILSYPVITSGEFAHKDSFKILQVQMTSQIIYGAVCRLRGVLRI